MFRYSLLIALLPAFVATLIHDAMFTPALDGLLRVFAKTSDFPQHWPQIAREYASMLDGIFKLLVSDKIGQAAILLVVLGYAPTSLWIFLQGGKSGRSTLLNPIIPAVVTLVGQVKGVGVVSPLVLPVVYAISKALEPAHQGIPAPPTQFYTLLTFGLHLIILITIFVTTFLPLSHPHWRLANMLFQISPIILFPLALMPTSKPSNGEVSSTKLFDYLKPLAVPYWWAAVAYGLFGAFVDHAPLNPISRLILLDNVGVIVTWVGIALVDWASGDGHWVKPGRLLLTSLVCGPPAAMCDFYSAKEKQGAKRVKALKKR